MSFVPMRTNMKLARLFYKYDEPKEVKKEEEPVKEKEDYETYPPYNFSWFIEGKIAAMGWPQTVANLNYLVDVGINHLITLSPERRPPILECERKLKWTEIRVKEFEAPSLKQVLKFIEFCERAQIRGDVIGVHCRHGRGRTGTMLACYLVHFKSMAPERAVLTVRVQRPGSCETYEQEKIVCHYHDCVRGTITKPDYRLVEDKLYFDCSMKYMYDDDENQDGACQDGDQDDVKIEDGGQTGEVVKKERKKSKAMDAPHQRWYASGSGERCATGGESTPSTPGGMESGRRRRRSGSGSSRSDSSSPEPSDASRASTPGAGAAPHHSASRVVRRGVVRQKIHVSVVKNRALLQ